MAVCMLFTLMMPAQVFASKADPVPNPTPVADNTGSSSNVSGCSHPNISWNVIKEATPTSDGVMEYKCPDCGYVGQVLPIDGYPIFIKNVCKTVKNAKTNETVAITTDRWMSFHHSVIEQMQKRPDVGMDLKYKYEGKIYEIKIPAGTDLSSLLDSKGYIGFLKLAEKLGVVQVAE